MKQHLCQLGLGVADDMALIQHAVQPLPLRNPLDVCSDSLIAHDQNIACSSLFQQSLPCCRGTLILHRHPDRFSHA